VTCGGSIFDLIPVVIGVYQGCILASTIFSTCMDCILGRMSESSSRSVLFGNVKTSELDFSDDAAIFVEKLDIPLGALKVLKEESQPPGLWVS